MSGHNARSGPGMTSLGRGALALGVALGVAGACRGEGPAPTAIDALTSESPAPRTRSAPLVLEALSVTDRTPSSLRPRRIPDELDQLVRGGFYGDTRFRREGGGEAVVCQGVASVGYALLQNREPNPAADVGEARALMEVELKCDAGDKDKLTFRVSLDDASAFGGDGQQDGPSTLERLLRGLGGRAADVLHGQVRMREASDADVLEALSTSTHEGILAEAASEAGERKLGLAVPALVRLTADERDLVAIRAGAALGLLRARGEDVIRALAHMTNGPNEEKHLVAINALGDIGGAEAVRYLRSIAEGHPNPALRAVARRAVARLVGGEGDEGAGAEDAREGAPLELP